MGLDLKGMEREATHGSLTYGLGLCKGSLRAPVPSRNRNSVGNLCFCRVQNAYNLARIKCKRHPVLYSGYFRSLPIAMASPW